MCAKSGTSGRGVGVRVGVGVSVGRGVEDCVGDIEAEEVNVGVLSCWTGAPQEARKMAARNIEHKRGILTFCNYTQRERFETGGTTTEKRGGQRFPPLGLHSRGDQCISIADYLHYN